MSKSYYLVIDHDNQNKRPADSRQEAEKMVETAKELGVEDVEIIAPDELDETEWGATIVDTVPGPDTEDGETDTEPPAETGIVGTASGEGIDAGAPSLNTAEQKAESIIKQLDHTDMARLVWDPDLPANVVPYNPKKLPYDRPEPSAQAYDLFASILEGTQGIQYSVEDVECSKTDEELHCRVTVVRKGKNGDKQLVGMKTRTRDNVGLDHWRERLYTKARRNALKQDIPPTWVSALLSRYQEVR